MIGVGLCLPQVAARKRSAASSFTAEADALFARFSSQPDNTRKLLIDATIISLKADGLWDKADAIWMIAAHDSQAASLNWKSTSFALTLQGTPTFTADRGYATNGTNNYVQTNYNPTSAAGLFVQDSATFGFWSRTSGQQSASVAGIVIAAQASVSILNRNASDQGTVRVNSSGSAGGGTIADGSGFFCASRNAASGAGAVRVYRNGSESYNAATASIGLTNGSIRLGSTGDASFAALEFAACWVGSGLNATEQGNLATHMQTYMTGVGA